MPVRMLYRRPWRNVFSSSSGVCNCRIRVCCGCIGVVCVNRFSVRTSAKLSGASGSMTSLAIPNSRDQPTSESIASAVAGTGPRGTYASRTGPTLRTSTLAIAPCESDLTRSTVEVRRAFAARHHVPIRLIDPRRPCLRKPFRDLVCGQPFPFAEKDLAERSHRLWRDADQGADGLRGLECALEVA